MKIAGLLAAVAAVAVAMAAVVSFRPTAATPRERVNELRDSVPVINTTGPQPAITVDPSAVFEFGDMTLGDTQEHVFTLKNKGEADLEVMKLHTTCKCTLNAMEDTVIPPGESLDVTLEWTPKSPAMEFVQHARIRTNDPKAPEMDLTIKGRVLMDVVLEPGPVWDVGSISEDAATPTTFTGAVASQVSDEFEVLSVRSETGHIDAELNSLPPDGLGEARAKSGTMVTLTVTPLVPVGRFNELVVMETNSERTPEVTINVAGNRPGPFSLLGPGWFGALSRLDLKRFSAAKGVSRQLTMFVEQTDEPMTFSNFRVDPPVLEVTAEHDPSYNNEKMDKHVITVTVPPGVKPGVFVGNNRVSVQADVNHPKFSRFNFEVSMRAEP